MDRGEQRVKVWILGSGSNGNAVLLEGDGTRVLVDVGFGPRTLAARLKAVSIDPSSIDACFLTHDHSDHVSGVARAARRWGWAVFATAGTAECPALATVSVTALSVNTPVRIDGLELTPIATPHDATEPVSFIATAVSTGARAAICYDVGHASESVRALCKEVDILVLEANHDEGMLRAGPYPPWLCERIGGGSGHLSNRAAAALARDSITARTAHVVLAHLSEKNNTPEIARNAVRSALRTTTFRGKLSTAAQSTVIGPFVPRGLRAESPDQYTLF
jgi:phosphoribosyl 1,2-cyclic phosphodiesterase